MTHRHTQSCPIAQGLNIFGDKWVFLIIRESLYGVTRFKDFQENTGIAKNLLTDRLNTLVDEGIFEKVNVGDRGTRYAYQLTEKGQSLKTIIFAIFQWGNSHLYTLDEQPVVLLDRKNMQPIETLQLRRIDGTVLQDEDILVIPGPGADKTTFKKNIDS